MTGTVTHGLSSHPLYNRYLTMIARCHNPKQISYKSYGAKGIHVCQKWRDSFAAFIEDMGACPDGFSIDRRDGSIGYTPENCYWADKLQQSRNRRNSRKILYNGEARNLVELAAEHGISHAGLAYRLNKGWSIERSIATPMRSRKHNR